MPSILLCNTQISIPKVCLLSKLAAIQIFSRQKGKKGPREDQKVWPNIFKETYMLLARIQSLAH